MLPILLGVFVMVQLFRFYRDAYLAEQLRLDTTPSTTAYEMSRMAMENGSSRTAKTAGIRTLSDADATASAASGLDEVQAKTWEPTEAQTISKPGESQSAIERTDEDLYN